MATKQEDKQNTAQVPEIAGVPIGGLGAGCIEFGRDGRFRNITINNNRTDSSRIPLSEGAFVAVRTQQKGRVFTRILQDQTGLPFAEAGVIPHYTPTENMSWRGFYPRSSYSLTDAKFPLQVKWTFMAPIIPYDMDASTLPLILAAINVRNTNDAPHEVATLFNWEDLCGCTRDRFPLTRGRVRPVVVKEELSTSGMEIDDEEEEPTPRLAGLEFGHQGLYRSNAEGHYCLLAKQQQDVGITIMSWDTASPKELRTLWQQFHDDGQLRNQLSRSETASCGAVACSFTLYPGESRTILYIFSWYCPLFVVRGVNLGNHYVNMFQDAIEVAQRALKHYRYYFTAVENWQGRFLSSSLPRWFTKMLINNNCVFSTNSLFTKDGRFGMMESPSRPAVGMMDRRFPGSLGTLLFFPDLETRELAQFAQAEDPDTPGRIYRSLGDLCFHEPSHGDASTALIDINAMFVLMAYRNYFMTGKRVALENLYPKLKQAMEYLLKKDSDGDGLPEHDGLSTTFDTWAVYGANSYAGGLWLTAVRAFAKLARLLDHPKDAEPYERLLPAAVRSFDDRLWNEAEGYYNLYDDPAASGDHQTKHHGCHCAQLAGQWYAHFLSLGHLLVPERIRRTLDSMRRINEQDNGVANGLMPDGSPCANPPSVPCDPQSRHAWPAYSFGHYSALQIYHGGVDRGLYSVQRAYKNIHVTRSRAFNQPLAWDLDSNDAAEGTLERHMSALSVWHVLYALQGLYLNLPEQTLWIRPNLPLNVRQLSAPLMTPAGLGWLKFAEETEGTYSQRVEIAFDGPIHLKRLVLRVPKEVEGVDVQCVSVQGAEETDHAFGYDGEDRLIEIAFEEPVMVGSGLNVALTAVRKTVS